MEPFSKKRRLAPKDAQQAMMEQSNNQQRFDYPAQSPIDSASQPLPQSSTGDAEFERYARHIQDAANMAGPSPRRGAYESVSVLLLRWEDDLTVADDLLALQKLFTDRYSYGIVPWQIPSSGNPTQELVAQVQKLLDNRLPEQLLIIYYVGTSYVAVDGDLYWACNAAVDSPKVPWDAVKNIIMDEPSDILFLLDCCALPDDSANGNNGVKQALAACAPDTAANEPGPNSFTYHLIDALHKLSSGPPFTAQQLHEELNVSIQALRSIEQNASTNGESKEATPSERAPVFFSLTPGNTKNIVLTPMHENNPPAMMAPMDGYDNMMHDRQVEHYQAPMSPALLFEEPRTLVSIQFPDEFGHEMVTFKQWLNSIPGTSTTVTVEGKFQGPPTILIMSMPTEIYNAISQERQCVFLGYTKSHNMVKEHQSLVDLAMLANQASNQASNKQLEDGKMLLDAASSLAAVSSPGLNKMEPQAINPPGMAPYEQSPNMLSRPMILTAAQKEILTPQQAELLRSLGMKDHESEMHEAAVQLKALSHVRPPSHDNSGSRQERGQSHGHLLDDPNHNSPSYHSPRQHSISSHQQQDMNDHSDIDGDLYNAGAYATPSTSRAKPRKSLTKSVSNKTDTRCSMCSHAPFKDSSSLRKHVAAAHTRPFPCAFAFAGCTSTFGSKNEWKRHIASQHLCLTYYRCSSCPQSQTEGKGNEFNRKDLFTQHLRRMHAPFAIKKQRGAGDNRLVTEWENHVKQMQTDCLVHRRQPPQRSACPKEDCVTVFEGNGSWDDWTEHVGRHMEKGEAGRLGVDGLLAEWALNEGIIEMRGGEYRLVGAERDGAQGGYFSDGQGQGGHSQQREPGNGQGVKREHDEMQRESGGGEEMIADELR